MSDIENGYIDKYKMQKEKFVKFISSIFGKKPFKCVVQWKGLNTT